MFSKFLPGQRDSQLLLDSDNFTYSRKKDKDTPLNTAWRCSKNRSLKCHAMVYLDTNNALSQGSKPHNHAPDNLIEEKSTFFSSLKRKAADQRITANQNIVSEVLEGASKDLNKKLPLNINFCVITFSFHCYTYNKYIYCTLRQLSLGLTHIYFCSISRTCTGAQI